MKNLGASVKAHIWLVVYSATVFAVSSCSDKVDGYLNKADSVINTYEEMAQEKKFSEIEEIKMMREIEKIDEEFKLNVGKEPDQWTEDQRVRRVKFAARIDKLKNISLIYELEHRQHGY